ncbi:MAG: Fic family protein [Candidatus Omnitrophota bacterium]|nr:Fic family protein [Candidatus Omnitrophota bacterium]
MNEINMRSGKWVQQLREKSSYKAFIPNFLPPKPPIKIGDDILELLSLANLSLGRLDGICEILPDIDFFIEMYIKREATSSSQIEGTQATFNDVLKEEANIKDNTISSDVKEILNYIDSINYGIEKLETLPLSLRLIRKLHSVLLRDTRGGFKSPGEFRKSQNWVGGKTINEASYVPPPVDKLMPLLDNFEKFLHSDIQMPALLKTALMHSQFESIHPFLDGNGRTGRLLINFFLYEKKILRKPLLYISSYFNKNRQAYYYKLSAISKEDDMEGWVAFFLKGIIEISEDAVKLSREIHKLREIDRVKTSNLGKTTKNALIVLDKLYSHPIISSKNVKEITGLATPNANKLISKFINLNILEQAHGKKRNRIFSYKKYLDLFEV